MESHIVENIMEITSVFMYLMDKGKLKDENEYTRDSTWNSFKNECTSWAKEFEEKFNIEDDYAYSIFKFAEEKILNKYGKDPFFIVEFQIQSKTAEDVKNVVKEKFPECDILSVIMS